MDTPQDFKSLQDQIQVALLSATRTANQIASEDLGFQRSLDAAVGTALDKQALRLLGLSNSLLRSAASISELQTPSLEDVEDVDNKWQAVVDVVDSLLEKADTCLDEYTGVIKHKSAPASEQVNHAVFVSVEFQLTRCCTVIIEMEKESVAGQFIQKSKSCQASTIVRE